MALPAGMKTCKAIFIAHEWQGLASHPHRWDVKRRLLKAELRSVYTRLSLLMWSKHLMVFSTVVSSCRRERETTRGGVCFMPYCIHKWIKLQFIKLDTHFTCFTELLHRFHLGAASREQVLTEVQSACHVTETTSEFFICSSDGSHIENQSRLFLRA